MIVSNINSPELEKYLLTNERFAVAFDFVKKIFADGVEDGRHVIDGDALYVNVMTYESKEAERSCFEAHKNYIDIQFIVYGTEVIYSADLNKLSVKTPYSAEKDIMFLNDYDNASKLVLSDGEYGIFFPWDAHKPGLCLDGKADDVKKIVVKVKFNS